MSNDLTTTSNIGGLKRLLESDSIRSKLNDILGERSSVFATSIVQIAQTNNKLSTAEPSSIVGAAITAATLNLPLNNNLGLAYIVPYNVKQPDGTWKTMAQFQIGWKGFVQLALRSGQFVRINATDVKEGEIAFQDRLTGDIDFQWETDSDVRLKLKTIGYVAYFRLVNGFEASLFMTMAEVTAHAKKYSQTFKSGFGNWKDDFESMALKTVLKLLLSKKAPLSVEMQTAVKTDQAAFKGVEETEEIQYIDNEKNEVDPELVRIKSFIEKIETQDDVDFLIGQVPDELEELFNEKLAEKNLKSS